MTTATFPDSLEALGIGALTAPAPVETSWQLGSPSRT